MAMDSDGDGLGVELSEVDMGCRWARVAGPVGLGLGVGTEMDQGWGLRLGRGEIKHGVGLGPVGMKWIWDWNQELERTGVKPGLGGGCRQGSR